MFPQPRVFGAYWLQRFASALHPAALQFSAVVPLPAASLSWGDRS
jgi:hypothetical protein